MTDLTERLRERGTLRSDQLEAADEIEHLRAELAALAETGPPMSRGTNADGTPKMGTMRDVLLDYMQAAEDEAGEVDELRAEVAEYQNASIDLADAAVSLAERMRAHLSPEDIATVVRLRDLLAARKAAP